MAEKASKIIKKTLDWLQENYHTFRFFTERDVVWTVQLHLLDYIEKRDLPYTVYNDFTLLPGMSADLVIINENEEVEVAVEFKYEPDHKRTDIPKTKFPVVFWGNDGVGKDVERIKTFMEKGKAQAAYAIFIDEGGVFSHRPPHPGSEWFQWSNGVSVLYSEMSGFEI